MLHNKRMIARLAGFALMVLANASAFAQSNLIARLRPGANPTQLAQQFGVTFSEKAPGGPFYLFVVPAGVDPHTVQVAMATHADVAWVEDDPAISMPEQVGGGKGSSVAVVNDRGKAYAQNTGALAQIGFSTSFASVIGRTVKVAVLDTGITPDCAILWAKVVGKYNAVENTLPYDVKRGTDSDGDGVFDEGFGHGTFVAGLVDQMSPSSKLVIVRVADSDGNSSAWRLVKGIAFAVYNGAEVANISLGSQAAIPALTDVFEWARLGGMLVVAAAGNGNLNSVDNPAGLTKAVAVTGLDAFDHKAVFANYRNKIESCAPATGLKSYGPYGRMMIWSGTSFASPLVAGSIAECLRHKAGKVDAAALFDKVKLSGIPVDDLNPNYRNELGLKLWIPDLWAKIQSLPLR